MIANKKCRKKLKNRFTHEIVTEGFPPFVDLDNLEATKKHISQLLQDGIVRGSNPEYASPLHSSES